MALGQDATIGSIEVSNVVVLQTGPSQLFGTASMDILNSGEEDDRLVAVIAHFADGAFQVREVDDAGFAKQVIVESGIHLPAGEITTLSPDGIQIAFLNLKQRLMAGDNHVITLRFERAGDLEIRFEVKGFGG